MTVRGDRRPQRPRRVSPSVTSTICVPGACSTPCDARCLACAGDGRGSRRAATGTVDCCFDHERPDLPSSVLPEGDTQVPVWCGGELIGTDLCPPVPSAPTSGTPTVTDLAGEVGGRIAVGPTSYPKNQREVRARKSDAPRESSCRCRRGQPEARVFRASRCDHLCAR